MTWPKLTAQGQADAVSLHQAEDIPRPRVARERFDRVRRYRGRRQALAWGGDRMLVTWCARCEAIAFPIIRHAGQRSVPFSCMVCTPHVRFERPRKTEIIEDDVPKEAFDRWLREQVRCEEHRKDTGHPRIFTRQMFFAELGQPAPPPLVRNMEK